MKVAALLAGQISIDSSWTTADFAELAVAAADQAGASITTQNRIAALLLVEALTECVECGASPAKTNDDANDSEARCLDCTRDHLRWTERLRGGLPDREHIAAMRERHTNERT